MARILVVYFSLTGNTRKLAEQLANATGAELQPIIEVRPRQGWRGYLRSALEAMRGKVAPTLPPALRADDYDRVQCIAIPSPFSEPLEARCKARARRKGDPLSSARNTAAGLQRLAQREPATSASSALQRLPRTPAIACALRLDLALVAGSEGARNCDALH